MIQAFTKDGRMKRGTLDLGLTPDANRLRNTEAILTNACSISPVT